MGCEDEGAWVGCNAGVSVFSVLNSLEGSIPDPVQRVRRSESTNTRSYTGWQGDLG